MYFGVDTQKVTHQQSMPQKEALLMKKK